MPGQTIILLGPLHGGRIVTGAHHKLLALLCSICLADCPDLSDYSCPLCSLWACVLSISYGEFTNEMSSCLLVFVLARCPSEGSFPFLNLFLCSTIWAILDILSLTLVLLYCFWLIQWSLPLLVWLSCFLPRLEFLDELGRQLEIL